MFEQYTETVEVTKPINARYILDTLATIPAMDTDATLNIQSIPSDIVIVSGNNKLIVFGGKIEKVVIRKGVVKAVVSGDLAISQVPTGSSEKPNWKNVTSSGSSLLGIFNTGAKDNSKYSPLLEIPVSAINSILEI
jgi:hypothetical protein